MPVLRKRATAIHSTSGTTWANTANIVNATDDTFGTWTNAARDAIGRVTVTGFDFASLPANAGISSVRVYVRHYMSTSTPILEVTTQTYTTTDFAYLGWAEYVSTVETSITVPDLSSLRNGSWALDLQAKRARSTTSAIWYIDWVEVEVDYSIPGPPATGETLTATGGLGQNRLSWTSTSGATNYDVYRDGQLLGTTTATTYSDTTVAPRQAYSYYIIGYNSYGSGPASNTVTSTAKTAKKAYWKRWNYGTNYAVTPTGANIDAVIQDSNLDTYVRINGTDFSSARAEVEPASVPTDIDFSQDISITMVFSASSNNGQTSISLWHNGIGTYYMGPYSQTSPSSRVAYTFNLNPGQITAADYAEFTVVLSQSTADFAAFVDIHEVYTSYASTLPDEPEIPVAPAVFQMVGVPI